VNDEFAVQFEHAALAKRLLAESDQQWHEDNRTALEGR